MKIQFETKLSRGVAGSNDLGTVRLYVFVDGVECPSIVLLRGPYDICEKFFQNQISMQDIAEGFGVDLSQAKPLDIK